MSESFSNVCKWSGRRKLTVSLHTGIFKTRVHIPHQCMACITLFSNSVYFWRCMLHVAKYSGLMVHSRNSLKGLVLGKAIVWSNWSYSTNSHKTYSIKTTKHISWLLTFISLFIHVNITTWIHIQHNTSTTVPETKITCMNNNTTKVYAAWKLNPCLCQADLSA